MLKLIKVLDKTIPLWEIIVILFALAAIVLVLVLWWAFGYNLIVVPEQVDAIKPAVFAASLI